MKVAFIGGGNMAGALIGGMLDAGFSAADIEILEIDRERGAELAERFKVAAHADAGQWLSSAQVVVLAVKPQQMHEATAGIARYLQRPLALSIAAGVRARDIAGWLATDNVVRAMPNMPALIRAGITGAVALPHVSAEHKGAADRILGAVGTVIWLEDEAMLDAVTAISGSGPAYVFYFIEAMQAAAREMGFSESHARAFALETFAGASQLAAQSPESAEVLRAKVTSEGGTTAAALASLDQDDVRQAFIRAMQAANARAKELGG